MTHASIGRDCGKAAIVALLCPGLAAIAGGPPAVAQTTSGKTLQLGIPVSGVVQKLLVRDGAHVMAGDIILQLDCRLLEADIKSREANLAAATAASERVRNGARPDEIAIGQANVGVAQARAEEAEAAYSRLSALTEGVSITRAQLLQTRRDARVTAAQLEDARKRLALLLAGSRAEDIREADAKRAAAAAELEASRINLDQCSLHAPVDGTVKLIATPGQYFSVSVPAPLAQLTAD